MTSWPPATSSGFLDLSETPWVDCDVTLDEGLAPDLVVLSPSLAVALGAGGRGRAWITERRPGGEDRRSQGERLLSVLFSLGAGDEPRGVEIAPRGTVRRGARVLKGELEVDFLAAEEGMVIDAFEEPTADGNIRHAVELTWVQPAAPGDFVIDARGRRAVVAGYDLGDGRPALQLPRQVLEESIDRTSSLRDIAMDQDTEHAIADAGLSTLHDTIADVQAAIGKRELGDAPRRTLHRFLLGLVRRVSVAHPVEGPLRVRAGAPLVGQLALLRPQGRCHDDVRARGSVPNRMLPARSVEPLVPLAQLRAVEAVGGLLFEDLVLRIDGPAMLEGAASRGEDVFDRDCWVQKDLAARPAWSNAVAWLDAMLAVVGLGIDVTPAGLRLVATALGASTPSREVATATPPGTRRGPTTAAWSFGAIASTRPWDVNGLHSQAIFGPVRGVRCRCGKLSDTKVEGPPCPACGTRVASLERARRFAHIALAAPVVPAIHAALAGERLGVSAKRVRDDARAGLGASIAESLMAAGDDHPHVPSAALVMRVLPVIPAALRAPNAFAGNLHDLYQQVIACNLALAARKAEGADGDVLAAAYDDLQSAVDVLIEEGVLRTLVDIAPVICPVGFAAEAVAVVDPAREGTSIAVGREALRRVLVEWIAERLAALGQASPLSLVTQNHPDVVAAIEDVARARPVWLGYDARVTGGMLTTVADGTGLVIGPEVARALDVRTGDPVTIHFPLASRAQSEVTRLADDRVSASPAEPSWLDHLADGDLHGLVRAALDAPVDGTSAGARLLLGRGRLTPS